MLHNAVSRRKCVPQRGRDIFAYNYALITIEYIGPRQQETGGGFTEDHPWHPLLRTSSINCFGKDDKLFYAFKKLLPIIPTISLNS
ncbi:hypothetical protein DPMN_113843 [Dreissena polymorpha]|uniref:Uncharacterized protein n=1 Tax=Dreissena polymorpha TaxID=45954 RepID=A0A9D4KI51_DREPO|nr:hypothetical protein DPMN_113843 [Dreissena polymorpha]